MLQYQKTLLPVLLLWCLFPVFGQETKPNCGLTISGQVTDHDTREPLIGATVYLVELQQGTTTDAFGNYHFHDICAGTYTLKSSYLGYETLSTVLKMRTSVVYHFKPHPDAQQLRQVQIIAEQLPVPTAQATATLETRELAQTTGQSVGEALKKVTGVTAIQTGPTIFKPVINGLHSNRILMLNNGVRQEGQQWGAEHAPEIDLFTAQQLTVVKGAAAVRYGSDAIGGVILTEPKPLRDSAGIGGYLTLAGASNNRQVTASGMVEGNLQKLPALKWRLQGTLKRAGDAKAPRYYLNNTAFAEHDFSGTLAYDKMNYGLEAYYSQFNTKLGVLSAAHIGNATDITTAINRSKPADLRGFSYKINRPYQDVQHRLLKLNGFVRTGELGKLRLIYAHQFNLRDEYDKHLPRNNELAALNLPEVNFEITTQTADLIWEHRAIRNISGSIGLSGMLQRNITSGRQLIPNFESQSGGIFWIGHWGKNKWQLEAGARYDYKHLQAYFFENRTLRSPEFTFKNFSGTLGSIYDLDHHWQLRASLASAWRSPSPNEQFIYGSDHGSGRFLIGDSTLVPEKAYNASATVSYHTNRHLNFEATFYYKHIENYIFLRPVFPPVRTIRGEAPTFAYEQAQATFKGMDMQATYDFDGKWELLAKVALVRAFNETKNEPLFFIPSDRFESRLTYNFGSLSRLPKFSESYASVGGTYVARQTRVPANADYMAPPAGYFLLNADFGTTLKLGKQTLVMGLSATNLLNTSYREYLNAYRYFADEMGRNVTLRVQVPFNFSPRK